MSSKSERQSGATAGAGRLEIVKRWMLCLCVGWLVGASTGQAAAVDTSHPGLVRRIYRDIGGGQSLDGLFAAPAFPRAPDDVSYVNGFESPRDQGEFYGQVLAGWVTPTVTGDYRFYLAAADAAALYLSFDAEPANGRVIAVEPIGAEPREWAGGQHRINRENVSAPIRLEQGRRYYVLAVHKEGTGSDHLAVTWTREAADPATGSAPIPGELLRGDALEPLPLESLVRSLRALSDRGTPGIRYVEAEDFDHPAGPGLPAADAPGYAGGAFRGFAARSGIDYLSDQATAILPADLPASAAYRTTLTPHVPLVVSALDPWAAAFDTTNNFRLGWVGGGAAPDWFNYTRTYAPGRYYVYAGLSHADGAGAAGGLQARLERVLSGVGTVAQVVVPAGNFVGESTGGYGYNRVVPLDTDRPLSLSGPVTLRLTPVRGDVDYLKFVAVPPFTDGQFASGFGSGLPAELFLSGAARVEPTGGAEGGYLRLTGLTAGELGTAYLAEVGSDPVAAFDFFASVRVGASGAAPAGGFSVSLASGGNVGLVGESGVAQGISVVFAAGAHPEFQVRVNGEVRFTRAMPRVNARMVESIQTGQPAGWAPLWIQWRADDHALHVSWQGSDLTPASGVPLGVGPFRGAWVIGARSGGTGEAHDFDDVAIRVRGPALTDGLRFEVQPQDVSPRPCSHFNQPPFVFCGLVQFTAEVPPLGDDLLIYPPVTWEGSLDGYRWLALATGSAVEGHPELRLGAVGDRELYVNLLGDTPIPFWVRARTEYAGVVRYSRVARMLNTRYVANDLFANREVINGGHLRRALRDFSGAGAEAFEPGGAGRRTAWWTWTAPANWPAGAEARVSLNDALSLTEVYTGSMIRELVPVPTRVKRVGDTCVTRFVAVAGTTYQIAVESGVVLGYFDFDAEPLSLNTRVTSAEVQVDRSTLLQVEVGVTNHSAFGTGPLRVRFEALAGYSSVGLTPQISGPSQDGFPLISRELDSLAPESFRQVTVMAASPAPDPDDPSNARGWGVIAILEESFGSLWLPVSRELVFVGEWPAVSGFIGPGGGVLRVDPNPSAKADARTRNLTDLAIRGPVEVVAGQGIDLEADAVFEDLVVKKVPVTWTTAAPATISPAGRLSVPASAPSGVVNVRAELRSGAYLGFREIEVRVVSDRPRLVGSLTPAGQLRIQVSGRAGREYRVERSADLVRWNPGPLVTTDAAGAAAVEFPLSGTGESFRLVAP